MSDFVNQLINHASHTEDLDEYLNSIIGELKVIGSKNI